MSQHWNYIWELESSKSSFTKGNVKIPAWKLISHKHKAACWEMNLDSGPWNIKYQAKEQYLVTHGANRIQMDMNTAEVSENIAG